ncbi:reverse transcriptase domain-containing protein [Tanacetum coccineum]
MSVRLAGRSFQYPIGKFTFPVDFVILKMEEDNKVPLILGRPFLYTVDVVIRFKQKQLNLGVGFERMIFSIDSEMKHSYSNDDTCFSIDFIDEILEEYFNSLLDEGSKILYSIEGTPLEDKIFAEFDEFIAMNIEENTEFKSDEEEITLEKITFDTDNKIKKSLDEPPTDLEIKPLPNNLEYAFLEEPFPVIISSQLCEQNKEKLISVLKRHNKLLRMPFGLCNALATFQRCMLVIFHDMIEESVELFMDDFSIFGNSFDNCLNNLDKILARCKDASLVLNWEKCHFMIKEGIVLRHKVSEAGLEVDKAKNQLKDNPAIWLRKLDDALWAFRTAYKTPTGTTPYKLIYGKNCHFPFEIEHRAYWALKYCISDLITAAVHIIPTGIDNDIYSIVDACANAKEMKFTSRDGESLKSYYTRIYKLMNELVRNKCEVSNHQTNVWFLLQLQPECQRFVTIIKQGQDLKNVSYHKLFNILKQHQNEVNEIQVERLARNANPLALVAATQHQPDYYPLPKLNYNPSPSTTRSQATTQSKRKEITRAPSPTPDLEHEVVSDEEDTPRDKEISKLVALISTSFKKIYKPTNNNLRTSSNTQNNIVQYSNEVPTNQELEARYLYMAKIQEVIYSVDEGIRPVFNKEPLEQVEFRRISLTGFRSCTSHSKYQSVSKQTTQYE